MRMTGFCRNGSAVSDHARSPASDLNSRLAVLKEKILHRVRVGHFKLPIGPFRQDGNLAVREVDFD
jgi:hypothetical protein